MGSTSYHREKGETDREHLQRELCGDYLQIVECATVTDHEYRVFYAAVRYLKDSGITPQGHTFGLVVLQRWGRGDYNYCRKEMDETMGPGYYDAPAKVLDALSPLDLDDTSYAAGWRAKCREQLAAKAATPKVTAGTRVRFAHPMQFTDGVERDTFTFLERSTFRSDDGLRVRITSWRKRTFEVAA